MEENRYYELQNLVKEGKNLKTIKKNELIEFSKILIDNLEKKVIESENLKKDSSNNEEDLIISLKQKINDLENTLVTSNNELELEMNTNKDRYNKYDRIQKQKNLYRNCFIFTIIILIILILVIFI